MSGVPPELVKTIVTRVAPKLFDIFRAQFADAGFDLGPMTPDLRADFADVDKRLADKRAAEIRAGARELRLAYPRATTEDD